MVAINTVLNFIDIAERSMISGSQMGGGGGLNASK